MNLGTRCLVAATGLLLSAAPFTASQAGAPSPGGWAIVQSDGTLGANRNVTAVQHKKAGIYRLTFNQDVSRCAVNATIASADGKTVVPGYIVVGHNHNIPEQIRVATFLTVTLLPADYRFDVVVNC